VGRERIGLAKNCRTLQEGEGLGSQDHLNCKEQRSFPDMEESRLI